MRDSNKCFIFDEKLAKRRIISMEIGEDATVEEVLRSIELLRTRPSKVGQKTFDFAAKYFAGAPSRDLEMAFSGQHLKGLVQCVHYIRHDIAALVAILDDPCEVDCFINTDARAARAVHYNGYTRLSDALRDCRDGEIDIAGGRNTLAGTPNRFNNLSMGVVSRNLMCDICEKHFGSARPCPWRASAGNKQKVSVRTINNYIRNVNVIEDSAAIIHAVKLPDGAFLSCSGRSTLDRCRIKVFFGEAGFAGATAMAEERHGTVCTYACIPIFPNECTE